MNTTGDTVREFHHLANFAYNRGFCPLALKVGTKYPVLSNWSQIERNDDNLQLVKNYINNNIKSIIEQGGGIGILTGKKSGIVVVDIDVKSGGIETWNKVLETNVLPDTLSVATGGGGFHYYFKYDDRTKNLVSRSNAMTDGPGIDVKADGGQVVFVGSIHPETKKVYMFNCDRETEIAEMPDWLYQKLVEKKTILKKKLEIKKKKNDVPDVKKLLSLLDSERVEDYSNWIAVGMILYNSLGNEGKDLWIEWSKQSSKFQANEINKKWGSFNDNGTLGIRSLYFWAKNDNPLDFLREFPKYNAEFDFHAEYYLDDLLQDINHVNSNGTIFDNFYSASEWLKERVGKCFRLLNTGKRQVVIKVDEDNPYIFTGVPNFTRDYGSKGVNYKREKSKESEKLGFCNVWSVLDNDATLDIKTIKFIPYSDEDEFLGNRILNIFPGYEAKKVEETSMEIIAPVLFHIKEILASGNEEYYQYLMLWLAFSIQKPKEVPGVMVVLYGMGGEGKSLFLDWLMMHVFGRKISVKFNGIDQLRKWSSNIKNKVFCWIDELVSVDTQSSDFMKPFEEIKGFVTDSRIECNAKFLKAETTDNYIRMIGTTNNKNPIPLRNGWERRLWFTKVSNSKCKDYNYFKQLKKSLNQETANHFFNYLLKMNIEGKNVQEFPITLELKELSENSLPLADKFLKDIKDGVIPHPLYDNELVLNKKEDNKGDIYYAFHTEILYQCFCNWCQEGHYKVPQLHHFRNACSRFCQLPNNSKDHRFTLNGKKKVGWWFYGVVDDIL